MSLSRIWWCSVLSVVIACGGSTPKTTNEPQTAKEKQLLEAKKDGEMSGGDAKKWGTWRYSGDRDECFFVVGRKCFKTEKAACKAAGCEAKKKKCDVVGGGPATVSCAKG
jgi:hypothetical protein